MPSEIPAMKDFRWEDVFAVNPDYSLRPDAGRAVIIDRLDPNACAHSLVDTKTAIVFALLDGKRTLKEVADSLEYLCDLDAAAAALTVTNFFRLRRQFLIRTSDLPPEKRIHRYDPAEFIAAGDDYSTHSRLQRPLTLLWMPTLECATRCLYCYMEKRPLPKAMLLTDERNRELIREIIALNLVSLTISGGDIFMHENIFAYLELLIRGGVVPERISTKVPLGKEQIRRLVTLGIKDIQYSIDGPNAEICDFLVQTPGWFERSVETIRMLVEAGFNVNIHVILTGYNVEFAADTARFFHSLGVRSVKFSNYGRSTFHHSEGFWVAKKPADAFLAGLNELRKQCPGTELSYKIDPDYCEDNSPPEKKKARWENRARCSAYTSSMVILPDGNCIGCEQALHDEFYSMGNLRDKNLLEVWNSKQADELAYPPRELFKGTVCFDCEDFDRCHNGPGYCFRLAYAVFGTIYAPPPECPRAPKGQRVSGCV